MTPEGTKGTVPPKRHWRFALALGIACAQVAPWPLVGERPGAHDFDRLWRREVAVAREAANPAAGGATVLAVVMVDLTRADGALVVDLDIVGDWGVTFAVGT